MWLIGDIRTFSILIPNKSSQLAKMKELFNESFYFLKMNWWSVFKIFGPFIIITSAGSPLIEYIGSQYPSYWNGLLYFFLTGMIHTYLMVRFIKFMASVASGREIELTVSLSEWHNLFISYIMYGVVVVVGLIVFIIPGCIYGARLAFSEFEIVLNGKSPIKAFGVSWKETKGLTLKLFFILFIIVCIQFVILGLLDLVAIFFPFAQLICSMLSEALMSVTMIYSTIIFFRAYVMNSPSH
ncbi:hypothetical protein ACXJY6_10735 [Vibrio sp. RC27]